MQTLQKNITNLRGEAGKQWLSELPTIIETLKQHWNLSSIEPYENLSYHYVAKALQNETLPVVLKIGCEPDVT